RLAESFVWADAMRTYAWRCLHALSDLPPGEGGRGVAHKLSAASVLFCADGLNRVLDHAAQVHGGAAYIWETEINRLYRAIKLLEIGAGPTEVRKLIIGEELLPG